tara:strand:- start:1276 stop:1518 length:243 start_codon:yes stop_codon:yes gene_type:complete
MYDILQTILLSIIIIYTIHYTFDYLKDTLTTHKTNNVLHKHNEKYQEILNIMKVNKQPVQQKQMSMKDELTAFLNQQNSK